MSIKRTIFAIHPMIRNLLFLLPLLAVLLLYFLQAGISIDSLKFGHFKVQGLYLKLGNKLILKIENLEIPSLISQDPTPQVTISIGISAYPDYGTDTRQLFQTADEGLYMAKENGRNQVCIKELETPEE